MPTRRSTSTRPLPPTFVTTVADTAMTPFPPLAPPALTKRHDALLDHCRKANLPVQYVGMLPVFCGHRVFAGQHCDWVLVNAGANPLLAHRNGFPIPRRALRRLELLRSHGLKLDAIFLAHEVAPGRVRTDKPLALEPLMPPEPRAVQRLSRRLGSAALALWLPTAFPAIGAALLAQQRAARVLSDLDPVVLGVLLPEDFDNPACWYYLTHWIYNQEA